MFASSVVVENRKGEILLIKEGAPEVLGKFNLPGGRADADESPVDCASRELFEEVGLNLIPTGLLGIYQHKRGLNFVFYAHEDSGQEPRVNDSDILGFTWVSQDEAAALHDEQVHRHKKLMMILDDLRNGHMYPLEVIRNVPSESWE
jgi:ADP-ribose pyrophosphatase YjhB (NUDIX family)